MSAQTEAIRIEYRAVAGCPSAAEFIAEVMKRTESARLVDNDDQARTFIVAIEPRRAGLTGSLRVREARSETVAREVEGSRCADVASTLALATALAIDPHASTSPTSPGDETATDNAAVSARPTSSAANGDDGQKPRPRSEKVAAQHFGTDSFEADSSGTRAPVERRVALGIGASLLTGVTPRVAFGGSVSAIWSQPRAGAWLSAYGADLTLLRSPSSETAGASATFQLLYARPIACTIRLGRYDGVSLSPCLGAELGVISGWGSDLPLEESHTKLWAAVELFARLRIGAKAGWSIEAQAGPSMPLTRYEFVFRDPMTRIHSVPRVAFVGGVRLGIPLDR